MSKVQGYHILFIFESSYLCVYVYLLNNKFNP